MHARFSWTIATTVALFCVYSYAQESPIGVVTQVCLGCMCEASTGCNLTIGCTESVCGPFAITSGYWAEAGKLSLNGQPSTNLNAYYQCVNDAFCAARVVQKYMDKYAYDCNGDGIVNCEDHLRLHRLGVTCGSRLNSKYERTAKLCLQTFPNQW